jgi:hypothetical protein
MQPSPRAPNWLFNWVRNTLDYLQLKWIQQPPQRNPKYVIDWAANANDNRF